MNYSTEYAELQRQFHKQRPDYGVSGHRYAEHILTISEKAGTRSILDYGCGKGTLQKSIPFPIQQYDPFIAEFSKRPSPADIVVCTDVMEHIEEPCLNDVLQDIWTLTQKLAFFQIATTPASKTLPDGRNAHLIQEPINWWLNILMQCYNIHQLTDLNYGFIVVCSPMPDWKHPA